MPDCSPERAGAAWSNLDLAGNPHEAADKAQRVRRMFASIARRYDLNNRLHSFGRDQAWRRAAVGWSGLQAGERVLDAACGTGDLAEAFARAGAASVTGIDFTPEMLELARAKARRPRRRGAAAIAEPRYIAGDVTALPLDDASFDIVSIAFGLRNVADPGAALREFRRVLRPGGRAVILEFARPRLRLVRAVNAIYCDRIMPFTAALLAGDRSGAYRYLPRSVRTFLHGPVMIDLLQQSGFERIEQHALTFGVCEVTVGRAP